MKDTVLIDEICFGRERDGYEDLLHSIRREFERNAGKDAEPIFVTDAGGLYDLFLDNIPAEARQHYNCYACRHFVNRFGRLVTIDGETGKQKAVMWGGRIPAFFKPAVSAIKKRVESAKVIGVFVSAEANLGWARTGVWPHMAVELPKVMVYKGKVDTASQAAAKKAEDFRILMSCIRKYKQEDVEAAVNLLRSGSLFQSEKILPAAEWFLETMKAAVGRKVNTNIVWYRSATAPTGFCHVAGNMLGTLLDDIRDGFDVDDIKARFNEKMNPLQYQRPQAAPSAGNVKRAEEIVERMGIQNSLMRRYARLDEVQTLWRPESIERAVSGGVFAGVPTKESQRRVRNDIVAPEVAITFEKFQRAVLPVAKRIEYQVPYGRNSYAAIVTAADPYAPPIILWDMEGNRNPFSWYLYHGGSTPDTWGLAAGYTEVTAIVLQPNMWNGGTNLYKGKGAMFVLEGAKDRRGTSSSCLFPEILKGELHEVRATIEAFSKVSRLSGIEDSDVCGLLIQDGKGWSDVHLRVTTDVGIAQYKIDRWD